MFFQHLFRTRLSTTAAPARLLRRIFIFFFFYGKGVQIRTDTPRIRHHDDVRDVPVTGTGRVKNRHVLMLYTIIIYFFIFFYFTQNGRLRDINICMYNVCINNVTLDLNTVIYV